MNLDIIFSKNFQMKISLYKKCRLIYRASIENKKCLNENPLKCEKHCLYQKCKFKSNRCYLSLKKKTIIE